MEVSTSVCVGWGRRSRRVSVSSVSQATTRLTGLDATFAKTGHKLPPYSISTSMTKSTKYYTQPAICICSTLTNVSIYALNPTPSLI